MTCHTTQSPPIEFWSVVPSAIPIELKSLRQWVVWKMAPNERGDLTKIPFQTNGRKAMTDNPSTWTTYSQALACYRSGGWEGIGPVFASTDPYCGVDLDGCRNPESGEISPWAQVWVDQFHSYVEVSPSGTGLKIWIRGKWPDDAGHKKQLKDVAPINGKTPAVEVYDSVRFFAMTGRVLGDMTEIRDCQSVLDQFRATYWPPRPPRPPSTRTCSQTESQVVDRAKKYIAMIPPAVSGQGGHNATFHVACVLVLDFALSVDDALDAIQDWNSTCLPPWSEKELLHKLEDANEQAGERGRLRNAVRESRQSCRSDTDGDYGAPAKQSNREPGDESESDAEPSQPRLKIRTAGELIKTYTRLRRPIIDGLLREGETANLISAPKIGKSWLVTDLALCIATGRPWLGRFHCHHGRVLIVDNELHDETLADRLPRVAMARGIEPAEYAESLHVVSLRGCLIDLRTLAVELTRLNPGDYDLIILDAFYRFLPIGTDENSNGDVSALYNLIDTIAHKIGCGFVLVHHTSKGDQSGKAITDIGAGAGSQSRATDTHIALLRHEVDGIVSAAAIVRSWPPPEPWCLRWEFPVFSPADEFNPKDLRTTKPRAAANKPSAEERQDIKDDADRAKVLAAYQSYPAGETRTVLAKKSKMSGGKFNDVNDLLITEGIVEGFDSMKARQPVVMYRLTEAGQAGQAGQKQPLSDLSGVVRQVAPPLGGDVVVPTSDRQFTTADLSDLEVDIDPDLQSILDIKFEDQS